MSDDQWYEIDVKATNKSGEVFVAHAEYHTSEATPKGAARDILDMAIKAKGNNKVVEIDPSR